MLLVGTLRLWSEGFFSLTNLPFFFALQNSGRIGVIVSGADGWSVIFCEAGAYVILFGGHWTHAELVAFALLEHTLL